METSMELLLLHFALEILNNTDEHYTASTGFASWSETFHIILKSSTSEALLAFIV